MLQFYEHERLDEKIGDVFTDDNSIVRGDHCVLLGIGKSCLAQLMSQRVFVDLLEEPAAKPITDGERTADDPFRYLVDLLVVSRLKHLCLSVLICGEFLSTPQIPARRSAPVSPARSVGLPSR